MGVIGFACLAQGAEAPPVPANAAAPASAADVLTPPLLTRFAVQVWKAEQGLPHNAAERLLQTRDGFLWIGTRAGLARFDGL